MRLCKLALVLGVAALLASPALAQRGRGGFGGNPGANPAILLGAEKVQKDLKMDKEQVEKFTAARQKMFEDLREEFQKLGPDSTEAERTAVMKKAQEAGNKMIKDVLSADQQKRLKQIQLQQQGIDVYTDADVQKTLKLSDEQKDKIKEIKKELDKEVEAARPTEFDPAKFQEFAKKQQALRKDALASAAKVLTSDQKKQIKAMQGEPLELKPEDFGFGRGRGGKPGGKPRDF